MDKKDIKQMNYVDLLSYIEETNRCPGGKRTIIKIMNSVFLPENSKILEIGSNTGFTSIEFAKLLENTKITGIDVNKNAVKKSIDILAREPIEIQNKINFQVGDASNLQFENNLFDLIVTGGANTFIDEKERVRAVNEYRRVLKPNGFLSVTNLFYDKPVPKKLLERLKNVLGFEIKPWKRAYWLDLLLSSDMELFSYEEVKMRKRTNVDLNEYVDEIIEQSNLKNTHNCETVNMVKEKWLEIMEVFNDNHEYLSFMIVVMRNNTVTEQRELFIEEGSIDPWTIKKEGEIWDDK